MLAVQVLWECNTANREMAVSTLRAGVGFAKKGGPEVRICGGTRRYEGRGDY